MNASIYGVAVDTPCTMVLGAVGVGRSPPESPDCIWTKEQGLRQSTGTWCDAARHGHAARNTRRGLSGQHQDRFYDGSRANDVKSGQYEYAGCATDPHRVTMSVWQLSVPNGARMTNVLTGRSYTVRNGDAVVNVSARTGAVLAQ